VFLKRTIGLCVCVCDDNQDLETFLNEAFFVPQFEGFCPVITQ